MWWLKSKCLYPNFVVMRLEGCRCCRRDWRPRTYQVSPGARPSCAPTLSDQVRRSAHPRDSRPLRTRSESVQPSLVRATSLGVYGCQSYGNPRPPFSLWHSRRQRARPAGQLAHHLSLFFALSLCKPQYQKMIYSQTKATPFRVG